MRRVSYHQLAFKVSAAVLACCPLLARAADGPYVGVEGGANWQSPQDQDLTGLGVIDRLHYKRGWEAGLIGGYSFDSGLRPELELSYRRNKFSHDFFGGGTGKNEHADGALANLWYDIKMPSGAFSVMHPYLGGGAGAVRFNNNTGALLGIDSNSHYDTEFGYQAGAGVGFDLSDHLTLSVDYRHLWTQKGGFPISAAPAPALAAPMDQRYLANTAMLSVRYSFGTPPAPPPVVAAPPPAPPPPPPVVAAAPPPPPVVAAPVCSPPPGFKVDADCHIIDQSIVIRAVDFETNSTRLTLPAQQTLDQVAQAFSAQPLLRAEVQGYTDSTGTVAYNLKLSQGRADAVKTYLIDKGVNSSSLTAHGYGPDNPVASNATSSGRAQNRRVTFNVTNAPAHIKVNTEEATPESTEAAQQSDSVKSRK